MVPSFCYQGNKIVFGSALESSFRDYLELHFPLDFLTSARANFVIYFCLILVGMKLKLGDDSAVTTRFRCCSYQIYYNNIQIKFIYVSKIGF
jgi:hypothetical protein